MLGPIARAVVEANCGEDVVMLVRSLKVGSIVVLAHLVVLLTLVRGQEAAPPKAQTDEPPPVPKGIEVMARGPVHEAFASLTDEPAPTKPVAKKPPKPIEEMPPAEKPEGNVIWINGYWAYDDDRKDFLWVSGLWRTAPPKKQWIAGYWREEGEQWQWVPGFWTAVAEDQETKEVTYLPQPPQPPAVAKPDKAPAADCFYVPGVWVWNPNTERYAWRAGYWARVQPGYVWVPDHYRWTPTGYLFIPGYWDLAVSRRGVLYAPVVIDPAVVTVGFYYTPVYAVSDTVVVDSLFVRPAYAHYYFGDYYGPAYAGLGYESIVVYSGRRYDSIIVYETWSHRSQPNWFSLQVNIYNGRNNGTVPIPPRTLVQQNTIIQQNITNVTNVTNVQNNVTNNVTNNVSNNVTNVAKNVTNNNNNNTTNVNRTTTNYNTPVLAPTSKVLAAKGMKSVPLDTETRKQAQQQAAAVQQVAAQRTSTEKPLPQGAPRQARVASLSVPKAQPVQRGFVAPKVAPQATKIAQSAPPLRPAVAPKQGASAANNPGTPGARPGTPNVPGKSVTPNTPPNRGGTPGRPSGQPSSGSRPGNVPPGGNSPPPRAIPGQPPRGTPGVPPRPSNQPPARRPPPKDKNDHR
jgi:hypothetical protein